MGLTVKNQTNYELGDNLTEFFSVNIETAEVAIDAYRRLKAEIFKLDIDVEEKANIINKINSLSTITKESTRKKVIAEIESFKEEYDL